NPQWATGLASSFRAGVAALPQQARLVVVTLVDQPRIGPEIVARLLQRHRPGRIVAAQYRDPEAGSSAGAAGAGVSGPRHPMVFDAELARAAADVARGDHGAREFLRTHAELLDLVD